MYHLNQARAIEPHVRDRICSRCWRRPRHSESLPPAVPRPCEGTCHIFQLLPVLVKRAELLDPMIASREHALREIVDSYCDNSPNGAGTLALYGSGVAHIVAEMVDRAG